MFCVLPERNWFVLYSGGKIAGREVRGPGSDSDGVKVTNERQSSAAEAEIWKGGNITSRTIDFKVYTEMTLVKQIFYIKFVKTQLPV